MKNKETLVEAAENYSKITLNKSGLMSDKQVNGFIAGAKWQQERSYSEEDLEVAFFEGKFGRYSFNDWFEQFKNK